MKVVRYINNEQVKGGHIPQTQVDNPAVVRLLRDVNRRIKSDVQSGGPMRGARL